MLFISVVILFQSCSSPDVVVKVGASGFFIVMKEAWSWKQFCFVLHRKADVVTNDVFFLLKMQKSL